MRYRLPFNIVPKVSKAKSAAQPGHVFAGKDEQVIAKPELHFGSSSINDKNLL